MTSMLAGRDISGFSGQLIGPGDEGYDEARGLFNAMIDRRPRLIARCASAADVAAVINFARSEGVPMSVYGGGHSVTGAAVVEDGIVCDLRGLKGIHVDPDARTVRAEGGVTWGEFDAATAPYNLAVTGGRVPGTGIGGLALGSGSGWLERKFGFTCDNLLAADVVTADGRHVVASETENPELFWGIRGGGGNFGVVTAFKFRVHPLANPMLAGMLLYPPEMAGGVVRHYRDFMRTAPDEVGGGVAFITAPPADFVPEPVRGHPVVGVIITYAGPPEAGMEVLRPLREFGPPPVDLVAPMPYVAVQRLIEAGNPHGMQNYWSADFLFDLPDEAVDVLVQHGTHPVSPLSQMLLIPGGGALSRVPEEATAFGLRQSPWNTHFLSMWPDPADSEQNIAYTRAISAAMNPWKTGRTYLNFIGDEGVARVQSAFGPEKYLRLQALKRVWDPDNFFSHNQNITPA